MNRFSGVKNENLPTYGAFLFYRLIKGLKRDDLQMLSFYSNSLSPRIKQVHSPSLTTILPNTEDTAGYFSQLNRKLINT
ncbi:hypothetical protein DVA44_20040 [Leclercia sp. W17]|nr:hypothetical protein DVA44_20040 [Leclercia sp. W17]